MKAPNPAPRRVGRPGLSREDIVAAARAVLAREGLAGFTVKAVAKRAGVTEPAIFHHFATKDALAGAIAAEIGRQEVEHLLRCIEKAKGAEATLHAMLRGYVDFYLRDLTTFRANYYLPQTAGLPRETLENTIYPLANALFGAVEARLREEQQLGKIPSGLHARRVANVVWTLGMGICCRAALFEATAARSTLTIQQLVDEGCAVLSFALRSGR